MKEKNGGYAANYITLTNFMSSVITLARHRDPRVQFGHKIYKPRFSKAIVRGGPREVVYRREEVITDFFSNCPNCSRPG